MTVICVNNYNYGMTGGQVSPTTPIGGVSTTTPYDNVESPFDLSRLAIGADATYVARWTVGYPYETLAANKSIVIVTLWDVDKPEYCERYAEFVESLDA